MRHAPHWQITVQRKGKTFAEFCVPVRRLGTEALKTFLRTVFVRYTTKAPEEMLPFYLNGKRGGPARRSLADVYGRGTPEHIEYWCGDWECFVRALQARSEIETAFMRGQSLRTVAFSRGRKDPNSGFPAQSLELTSEAAARSG
jgi:hypothetical protein